MMNKEDIKQLKAEIKAGQLDLARRVKECDRAFAVAIKMLLKASKVREGLRKEGVVFTPAEKKQRAATMKADKLQRRRDRYAIKKAGK